MQSIARETPCIEKTFFDAFMWVYRIKEQKHSQLEKGCSMDCQEWKKGCERSHWTPLQQPFAPILILIVKTNSHDKDEARVCR